ncbi:MAG: hypothetical protein K6U74_20185 [Firmicutes bacterium]|nr:hypothetical protein [Bacillota bacterium]
MKNKEQFKTMDLGFNCLSLSKIVDQVFKLRIDKLMVGEGNFNATDRDELTPGKGLAPTTSNKTLGK